MDIKKRKLRKIEIEDSTKASKAFELLMGNEVSGRRDFIINNGGLLDRDKIDF
jgi:DNA gyrase subunit B